MFCSKKIYDIIGIGIGPFNLGLAAIITEFTELDSLFLEKKIEFDWHPGLMLDRARLQVPYYADLVTLLSPRSRFSYLNYLFEQQKMFAFGIHDHPFILRKEYNRYCQWVTAQLKNCEFSSKCSRIEYQNEEDCFRVSTDSQAFSAKRIVIGTGTVPHKPDCCKHIDHPMVFHSSKYLFIRPELIKKKRITVIGSGQSAAEIFYDLLCSGQQFDELRWYTRSDRLFPMDYSKFSLQMATPAYIEEFFRLSPLKKQEVLRGQDPLYKGINHALLNTIYDELYVQRENGMQSNVEIVTACELHAITANENKLVIQLIHNEKEAKFSFETDAIVLATGYKYKVPAFLNPVKEMIRWREDGFYDVQHNYSVDFADRIFVQNADWYSHGFNSADLSLGPYRNAVILNTILGKEYFKIENGRNLY